MCVTMVRDAWYRVTRARDVMWHQNAFFKWMHYSSVVVCYVVTLGKYHDTYAYDRTVSLRDI